MSIGLEQMSQQYIMGLSTFSPMRVARWLQSSRSMGSGGPRWSVVNTGASNCDMSDGTSTENAYSNEYIDIDYSVLTKK